MKSAGSKAGPQNVAVAPGGLKNGTTYHYRLVAKNDAGTTFGSDLTFATRGVTIAAGGARSSSAAASRCRAPFRPGAAGEQVTVFAPGLRTGLAGLRRDRPDRPPEGPGATSPGPGSATSYLAGWQGGTSTPVSIGVHPAISLHANRGRDARTHVSGGNSFRGRVVQLQRRTAAGKWVTIRRGRLTRTSRVAFKLAVLPRGRSTVRVVMSINQAGAGFLGGKSRTIAVTTVVRGEDDRGRPVRRAPRVDVRPGR